MIEKLLKITNPLASSNHGNSPPKIDDSKHVKTTKISTLISSMSLKPAKKRTVIAFPLKPVKPKIEEKSKNEINKETKIPENTKQEQDVSKTDQKSDNSDSLLDNNSDSKSENTISNENSPNLQIKSSVTSVSESHLPVTTVSQPKQIEVKKPSSPNLSSAGSFESSSNEESTISTSSSQSSSSPQNLKSTTLHASSGYGSEGYVSENSAKSIETAKITPIVAKIVPRPAAKPAIQLNKTHVIQKVEKKLSFLAAKPFLEKKIEPKFVDIRDEKSHCARCHKSYNPNSSSNAEMRCLLPHPTNMVVALGRDANGTNFVCLCCRTEFKLPKMTFYEAGVNSMLTGYCFVGQHTSNLKSIDYQDKGGAALSCEEAGCIEFFV